MHRHASNEVNRRPLRDALAAAVPEAVAVHEGPDELRPQRHDRVDVSGPIEVARNLQQRRKRRNGDSYTSRIARSFGRCGVLTALNRTVRRRRGSTHPPAHEVENATDSEASEDCACAHNRADPKLLRESERSIRGAGGTGEHREGHQSRGEVVVDLQRCDVKFGALL